MTEAIFGLIGVIIGGVLQTGANWWMERRREDWAARKAGRLLAPAFGRSQFIFNAATKVDLTWGAIALEVDQCLERWPEHADVLAGTIEQDDWNTILHAVSALQRIQQRAHSTPDEKVEERDREFLGDVSETIWAGAFTSSMIGTVGTRKRPRRFWRKLCGWTRGKDKLEEEVNEVVRYSYEIQGADPPDQSADQPSDA